MRVAVCLIACALAVPAWGQLSSDRDRRLRVERFRLFNECQPMDLSVVVQITGQDSPMLPKLTLTTEQVQTVAEARLRSARLYDPEKLNDLRIAVQALGRAFHISFAFRKMVQDVVSKESWWTTTWENASLGTHDGDANFILSSVSQQMDEFLVDYLRVNEDACE